MKIPFSKPSKELILSLKTTRSDRSSKCLILWLNLCYGTFKLKGNDQTVIQSVLSLKIFSLFVHMKFHILAKTDNFFLAFLHVMRCAIWYHLYNLKNVKNIHGGVLILVKLQASACSLTLLHGFFFTFFILCKWYQIAQHITYNKIFHAKGSSVMSINYFKNTKF